jgi:hypothetical protein
MAVTCVLLAINSNGVSVAKEYLVDVDEIAYGDLYKTFKAKYPGMFVAIFNERELGFHLDEIRRRRFA